MPYNLMPSQGIPVPLLKFQMAPWLRFLTSSESKEKETKYACLSEAKALHSHKTWGEVCSSAPNLLHKGLLFSPIKWWCILRVLCPIRRQVTTLDCVLLKDRSLVFAVGLGPKISFWACLWVLIRPHHLTICWLSLQDFIFLLLFGTRAPKAGSGPTNFWKVPFLDSFLAVSFPRTPECPATQNSPSLWWVEVSFTAFWHSCSNGEVVLATWWAYRAAWLLEQILTYFSDLSSQYMVACVSFKATK